MLNTVDIFFLLLVCGFTVNCGKAESYATPDGATPKGFLGELIKEALEKLRPMLGNLRVNKTDFVTGPQEFGEFEGYVDKVDIKGLENFTILILDMSFFDIKNLTILEEKVNVTGIYNINGSLAFPLGKNDIHLFGNGEMSAELTNFSISIRLIIRLEEGRKVIKELDIEANIKEIHFYLSNLMGGGELETVFNQIINDVILTVFNYYKKPVLETIKPEVKKIILEILNPSTFSGKLVREEL